MADDGKLLVGIIIVMIVFGIIYQLNPNKQLILGDDLIFEVPEGNSIKNIEEYNVTMEKESSIITIQVQHDMKKLEDIKKKINSTKINGTDVYSSKNNEFLLEKNGKMIEIKMVNVPDEDIKNTISKIISNKNTEKPWWR